MRVVICGAGQVGFGIAEKLASEGNDVSVIDTSPQLIRKVSDVLDVRGFIGHGSHPDVLAAAGAEQADMLIAVTLYDEVNITACQVAHTLFNVPTKIARIRHQSYLQPHWGELFSRGNMPIDVVISPELEVGEMVLRRLALPGSAETASFADDTIIVAGIRCGEDCPVIDTPLRQLSELFPDLDAVVVGIQRGSKVFAPASDDVLYAGDLAYVATPREQIARTLVIFGRDEPQPSRVIIAGGGNVGLYVAEAVEKRIPNAAVRLIEGDRRRAVEVADKLSRCVVLHGDVLDEALLREADIAGADTLVAVTNDEKINVLACVMAKRLGCRRNLCLINSSMYAPLIEGLGIDADVNPRSVTISKVLQHVRRGRIRSVQTVANGAAEILEAEALETSPLVGLPLRELTDLDGLRIGAILRNGKTVLPRGSTVIEAKDRVVVFAESAHVKKVEHLFRVSLEFF